MMKCTNCGMELPEGARFCAACGTIVDNPVEEKDIQKTMYPESQPDMQQNEPKKKSRKLAPLVAVAAVAVIIVVGIIAIIFAKNGGSMTANGDDVTEDGADIADKKDEISLQDYATVSHYGYEGYGMITVDFDYDSYYADLFVLISENADMSADSINELWMELSTTQDAADTEDSADAEYATIAEDDESTEGVALTEEDAVYVLCKNISYEVSEDSRLSNGDVVTVTFQYDEECAELLGVSFAGTDSIEYEVSGMEDVVEIDPFEDITVEFSGTADDPYAETVNNSTDELIAGLELETSDIYETPMLDRVTVYIDSHYAEDEYIATTGNKFTRLARTYIWEDKPEEEEDTSSQTALDPEQIILYDGKDEMAEMDAATWIETMNELLADAYEADVPSAMILFGDGTGIFVPGAAVKYGAVYCEVTDAGKIETEYGQIMVNDGEVDYEEYDVAANKMASKAMDRIGYEYYLVDWYGGAEFTDDGNCIIILYVETDQDERLTAEILASRMEDLNAYLLIITVNDEEFIWQEDTGVLPIEEADQSLLEEYGLF